MALETFTMLADYGLQRVTGFRTLIKDCGQGHEQRIAKNPTARHKFRLVFSEHLTSEMQTGLYQFYLARKGAFESFQIADPVDSTVRVVRFEEDELTEEMFYRLLENSEITVIEVTS